ncbi:hypothetical protein O983_25325 [Mycobacterium avium 09-5983]|nr:hypothetical protein O984_00195 [Mycobacterium avium 05-4293]ETB18084.1 hypothetical protein O983_25325 [Mycobacterium avium 09-5983]
MVFLPKETTPWAARAMSSRAALLDHAQVNPHSSWSRVVSTIGMYSRPPISPGASSLTPSFQAAPIAVRRARSGTRMSGRSMICAISRMVIVPVPVMLTAPVWVCDTASAVKRATSSVWTNC